MSARQQQEVDLKSRLEIAATIKMVHPEWVQGEDTDPARMFVNRESASDLKRSKKEMSRICITCKKTEDKGISFKMCDRVRFPSDFGFKLQSETLLMFDSFSQVSQAVLLLKRGTNSNDFIQF